jgi:hypothetical protein
LAFLDEDDPLEPEPPVSSRRAGASRQRQFVVRRLFGVAIVVGVLILLLFGFKGCLDARKERGFENYVSDLTAISTESQQLSEEFFKRLEDSKGLSELQLEAQISADRGTAEGLVRRVEGLDTPDEMKPAQSELTLAFELRRDGISGIAEQIQTALGKEGRQEALKQIAAFMRYFLASDVLYARSADEMNAVLEAEGIAETIPDSVFLPDPVDRWLDETQLSSALAGVAGDTNVAPGIHGMGLIQTEVNPGGVVLSDGAAATVSESGPYELVVQAQNQGESEETDVGVTFELSGGSFSAEGEATIPRIAAGETGEATVPIDDEPPAGEELTLTVSVTPVPGEEVADNNEATYTVTFG